MKIEGAISVKAAISNNKREVTKVYIDKNKKTKIMKNHQTNYKK